MLTSIYVLSKKYMIYGFKNMILLIRNKPFCIQQALCYNFRTMKWECHEKTTLPHPWILVVQCRNHVAVDHAVQASLQASSTLSCWCIRCYHCYHTAGFKNRPGQARTLMGMGPQPVCNMTNP